MPKYEVGHAYRSYRDGVQYGPWVAGDVVELAEADAQWVERDSSGCLSEVKAKAEPKAAERQQPAGKDRQHRGAANRGS